MHAPRGRLVWDRGQPDINVYDLDFEIVSTIAVPEPTVANVRAAMLRFLCDLKAKEFTVTDTSVPLDPPTDFDAFVQFFEAHGVQHDKYEDIRNSSALVMEASGITRSRVKGIKTGGDRFLFDLSGRFLGIAAEDGSFDPRK